VVLAGRETSSKLGSDLDFEIGRRLVNIGELFLDYNVARTWSFVEDYKSVKLANQVRVRYIAEGEDAFFYWLLVHTRPREITLDSVGVGYANIDEVVTPALGDVRKIVESLDLEKIPVIFPGEDKALAVPLIPVDLPSALNLVAGRGTILEVAKVAGVSEDLVDLVDAAVRQVISTTPKKVSADFDIDYEVHATKMKIVPSNATVPELIYRWSVDSEGDVVQFDGRVEFIVHYRDEDVYVHYALLDLVHHKYSRSLSRVLSALGVPLDLFVKELASVENYFVKASTLITAFKKVASLR